jgi:threonine/homoserine/homoserine lactone efflux protein
MDFIWLEFFKVALAHLLAVASPGPDFAIPSWVPFLTRAIS